MAKRDSPSAQRNKEPIWDVLKTKVLPALPTSTEPTRVLEIAAGCGVHSHHFSLQMLHERPNFLWYPSDPEESSRASIQAYLDDEAALLKDKLQPPVDVTLKESGAVDDAGIRGLTFDFMLCINMIHISPWTATLGLFQVASKQLAEGGILYLYGPYKVNGTAVPSNLNFDHSLQSRDPSWGVRNLEDVLGAAKKAGLDHVETIEMPANNLSVILQKKKI